MSKRLCHVLVYFTVLAVEYGHLTANHHCMEPYSDGFVQPILFSSQYTGKELRPLLDDFENIGLFTIVAEHLSLTDRGCRFIVVNQFDTVFFTGIHLGLYGILCQTPKS